ncbi:kinase-like domain-containing protein, partial [Mycena crocata]
QQLVAGGSFSDVCKGSFRGQTVAIKMMRVFANSDIDALQKEFGREALVWRQLSHPNLFPFFGLYYAESRLYLVSPWMENRNIRTFSKTWPCFDVVLGLQHLHDRNIVHGDLKADNIFITPSMRPCIADFGLSSIISTVSSAQLTNSSKRA